MDTISESVDELRNHAQQLVTDIAGGTQLADLHASALKLLLKVVELQTQLTNVYSSKSELSEFENGDGNTAVREEINKVARKLPKWASKQSQINSRILALYLELRRGGEKVITENQLCDKYGNVSEFYRNYPQMKSISPKNHAKVFDSVNGVIQIWEPVKRYVDEYERIVFSDSKSE